VSSYIVTLHSVQREILDGEENNCEHHPAHAITAAYRSPKDDGEQQTLFHRTTKLETMEEETNNPATAEEKESSDTSNNSSGCSADEDTTRVVFEKANRPELERASTTMPAVRCSVT
jgi:hypothetical protein